MGLGKDGTEPNRTEYPEIVEIAIATAGAPVDDTRACLLLAFAAALVQHDDCFDDARRMMRYNTLL